MDVVPHALWEFSGPAIPSVYMPKYLISLPVIICLLPHGIKVKSGYLEKAKYIAVNMET